MAERKFAWPARAENKLIGKDIERIDGATKASGQAKYTADVNTKGTLFAKLVTCPHGAAKLSAIDADAAKKVAGVRVVYLFKKVGDNLSWDGDLVAAVAADRAEQAADGVKAIEATVKYEVLPHFVDEADLEAGKKAERFQQLTQNSKGDVEKAIQDAKAVHKGRYGIHTISHMCLEPHGTHCEWSGENLDAHLSTQNVTGAPKQFADALKIGESTVTATSDYEGGGFGSKFSIGEWGIACAKMAKEAGKPVRLMLDRATELKTAGTRPSGFVDVTLAADADGNLTAWDSVHWGTAGVGGGGVAADQLPYAFPNVPNRRVNQIGLKCNTGPMQAWRAPNHPQACAISQTALDDLAAKLKMSSYDFFAKNLHLTQFGKAAVYLAEMEIAAKAIDWKAKWHPHGDGGKGPVKRGLGMALHTWGGAAGGASCNLKIHPDGSVETLQGSQDIGTGTRTVIAITVAETFGLPVSAVKVSLGSSKLPACGGSGGSTTIGGVTGANRRAAMTALWKIFDKVAEKYKLESTDNLVAREGNILNGKEKVCTWKQACSLLDQMPLEVAGEGRGNIRDGLTADRVGGVQMADVSVDTETGVIRINKFVCVQDCGLIVDELTARSQVLGAMIMGISYALTEERIMDNTTGRYINADLQNYKLPRIGDVGELVAIMYQPDSEYDRGVVGLGEPPVIAPGATISNAVANAIGVRVPVLPMTPKRVLDALKGGKA